MKDTISFSEIGDKSVFSVPEGYFEGLNARIGELVDQSNTQSIAPKHRLLELPGKMERFRPILYLAAMFVLLLFSVSTIVNLTTKKTGSNVLTQQTLNSKQTPTVEDYLINQVGTSGITEYYVDPEVYEN